MKAFIPPLMSDLVLQEDWTFNVSTDFKNGPFLRAMFPKTWQKLMAECESVASVTLRAGTVLRVRTIDIRQGGYTKLAYSTVVGRSSTRLIVTLEEANKMHAVVEDSPVENDAAVAAISYALSNDEGMQFLNHWNEGNFDVLREFWKNIPDEVFIGADPLFKPKEKA